MKLGMVGLPNVGKSTLFNALTNAGAESANYPFCTIEKNIGIVSVPDERLDRLAEMYNPEKFTPATLEFVDIAGLVKGASKGEGLGNKFLDGKDGAFLPPDHRPRLCCRCFARYAYKWRRCSRCIPCCAGGSQIVSGVNVPSG